MVRAQQRRRREGRGRGDRLEEVVIVTDWNGARAEFKRGAARGLQRWRRPVCGTEGCIGFRPDHVKRIAARITFGTRLIVPNSLIR